MIDCAVLGGTGAVGQRFLSLLDEHPMFQVTQVVAGAARQGTAVDEMPWRIPAPRPARAGLHFVGLEEVEAPLVFSALPGKVAGDAEADLVARGHKVFTNASPHRMDPDVPLLIPEVNPDAIETVRGKQGFLIANGNCSGIILTMALAPLQRAFGLAEVDVVTQQALSGAGHDGVDPDAIRDNLLPLIPGEEEKLQAEPCKVLGARFPIRATCTRVNVTDGHFETVHVRLGRSATALQVRDALAAFPGIEGLPSAPRSPIHVMEGDRPQPRLDRELERGMAIAVGRIRCDGDRARFVVLGHNTLRGAAGQSVLNAEFAASRGLL